MVPICAGRCVRLHFPDKGSKVFVTVAAVFAVLPMCRLLPNFLKVDAWASPSDQSPEKLSA